MSAEFFMRLPAIYLSCLRLISTIIATFFAYPLWLEISSFFSCFFFGATEYLLFSFALAVWSVISFHPFKILTLLPASTNNFPLFQNYHAKFGLFLVFFSCIYFEHSLGLLLLPLICYSFIYFKNKLFNNKRILKGSECRFILMPRIIWNKIE